MGDLGLGVVACCQASQHKSEKLRLVGTSVGCGKVFERCLSQDVSRNMFKLDCSHSYQWADKDAFINVQHAADICVRLQLQYLSS